MSNVSVYQSKEFQTVQSMLEKRKDDFGDFLQRHNVPVKSFLRGIYETFGQSPQLLKECTPESILKSCMDAARYGYYPSPINSRAHITPFKVNVGSATNKKYETQAKYQIGYLGYLDQMRKHHNTLHVTGRLVYENDEFEQHFMPKPQIIHNPPKEGPRGNRIGAYAIIFFKDRPEFPEFVYMNKDQIMDIKSKSKGSESEYSPWAPKNDPNGWMWMKSPIKALAKMVDLGEDLRQMVTQDDAVDADFELMDTPVGQLNVKNEAAEQEETIAKHEERGEKATSEVSSNITKEKPKEKPKAKPKSKPKPKPEPEQQEAPAPPPPPPPPPSDAPEPLGDSDIMEAPEPKAEEEMPRPGKRSMGPPPLPSEMRAKHPVSPEEATTEEPPQEEAEEESDEASGEANIKAFTSKWKDQIDRVQDKQEASELLKELINEQFDPMQYIGFESEYWSKRNQFKQMLEGML
jgi:phage RecT family recombinase